MGHCVLWAGKYGSSVRPLSLRFNKQGMKWLYEQLLTG